jgi:stage IV sporulation protein FB
MGTGILSLPVAALVVKSGYLWIGRFRGAPIRLHWSVPLGVVAFTGFRLAPGAWLGFVLLILVHELGHAIPVARAGLRVVSVDVLGIGGLCRYDGYPTPRRRVLIAWGGVLAQAALGLATLIGLAVFGRPSHLFVADLLGAFLFTNLWLIGFNLLPIPPLDGVEAWGVIGLVRAARARRRMDADHERATAERLLARARATEGTIRSLDELDEQELPPMPDEVRRVLDRIRDEGRAQHESEKKK